MRLWTHLAALCIGALSCTGSQLQAPAIDLHVQPTPVSVSPAWVGRRAATDLMLWHDGTSSLDVRLSVPAPFRVPAALRVPPGHHATVTLELHAEREGPNEASLTLAWDDRVLAVPVTAEARSAPACAPCTRFAEDTQTCAPAPADGETCATACVPSGTCSNGACVGAARACDDGNPCTVDSCGAAGCQHTPLTCPETACEQGVCDVSRGGCTLQPKVDGTRCGDNDCATAHVCITGRCVTRAALEGSTCADATPCRGESTCREGRCHAPAAGSLRVVWRYEPPVLRGQEGPTLLVFANTVDLDGNVYLLERRSLPRARMYTLELVSLDARGHLRFRALVDATAEYRSVYAAPVLDEERARVLVFTGATLQARSVTDGRVQWSRALEPLLPAEVTSRGNVVGHRLLHVGSGSAARYVATVMAGVHDHSEALVTVGTNGDVLGHTFRHGHYNHVTATRDGGLLYTSSACWGPIDGATAVDSSLSPVWGDPSVRNVFGTIGDRSLVIRTSGDDHLLSEVAEGRVDRTFIGSGWMESAVFDTSTVYGVTGAGLVSACQAFDRRTGQLKWTTEVLAALGGPRRLQLLRDGGLAAGTSDQLSVLGAGGELNWTCAWPEPSYSPNLSIRSGLTHLVVEGPALLSVAVPGLDEAPSGWTTERGSLAGSYRPRE